MSATATKTVFTPIGDRVLIRPVERPEQTESGLFLSEHRKPHTAGIVVAVGTPPHPRKRDAERLAKQLRESDLSGQEPCGICGAFYEEHGDMPHGFESGDIVTSAADLLCDLVRHEPSVKVGDYVLFSWQSGQLFDMDDDKLLVMRESDILAVVEEQDVVHG